jgi:sarcosine oxidase
MALDVIVVGGGIMGSGAAYHLAKDGLRVLVLEQFAVGHTRGSSHGPSRMIRLAYDAADYVQLARASYALWHEIEAESAQSLLVKTGGFDFGPPGASKLAGIRETYEALEVPFEALDRDEIVRRFPQFSLPDGTVGYYQGDYSILSADRCLDALVTQARRRGTAFSEGETVQDVRASREGVEVRTDKATYHAGRLVLAAGSWMRPLLQQLDLDLPLAVRKEQVAFFKPRGPTAFQPGRFPLFIQHFLDSPSLGSGFPIFGHSGVKLMLDRTGPRVDHGDPDRAVEQSGLERLRAYAAGILPALGTEIIEAVTCRYTMTPDEDFIIDRHPAHSQVVIASACSGHGFKFAVVVGHILADLATRGATSYNIERFRLDRPPLRTDAGGLDASSKATGTC